MNIDDYRVQDGKGFSLRKHETRDSGGFGNKAEAAQALADNIKSLVELQEKLYAHNRYGVLVILQAMDAAGKDGAIRHVMSGLNPQGVQVKAFKAPSVEELDHDYLWRGNAWLPARGNIAIFNRSYYEDVVVVRVHNLLHSQNLPEELAGPDVWKRRYRQIRDYERYLTENGIVVVKFFLNISREEQGQRLLARIDEPEKNWKFSPADVHERKFWDQYMDAYDDMIRGTATAESPWHIVPSDRKWFSRLLISEVLVKTLQALPLAYPKVDEDTLAAMATYRRMLVEAGETAPAAGPEPAAGSEPAAGAEKAAGSELAVSDEPASRP